MAKIFPPTPPAEAPPSEKQVFAVLRDRLPDDYIVFHGQRINSVPPGGGKSPGGHAEETEVDFIIFHPRRGYLVLEVKGGGIRHDARGWISVGRDGERRIKDPGRQAQIHCRAIDDFLRKQRSYAKGTPRYAWAVCFPDLHFGEELQTLELPPERVINGRDLKSEDLDGVFQRLFECAGAPRRSSPYDPEAFTKGIAPQVNLVPRLSDRWGEEALELVRLTEEQFRILEFMGSNQLVAIRGGAGTGKTMIALERARRLAEAGEDVLLLCFNEPLAAHLARQLDGGRVATFHQLSRELAAEAGLSFEVPADEERQRIFWEQGVPYLLVQALERLPHARWDHVIVDEGQDFMLDWWSAIFGLRRNEDSSLWVMYDPNQKVYGTEDLSGELQAVLGELRINCRNTRRISARLSELIPGCADCRDDAPEGEEVVRISVENTHEMLECVRTSLHTLLNQERIDPNRTVVLSPRLPGTSEVWRQRVFGNWRLRLLEDDPLPNTVRFSSLHRFKGLEADAVILCEVKPGAFDCSPLRLYVASSRAKHLLHEMAYG